MPFKANAARRHHIPKQQYRVTNWAEYDEALRQRGSLTVWFTEEAIAAWRAERQNPEALLPEDEPSAPAVASSWRIFQASSETQPYGRQRRLW